MSITSIINIVSIFFAGFVVNNGIPMGLSLFIVLLMSVFYRDNKWTFGSLWKGSIVYCNACCNEYFKRIKLYIFRRATYFRITEQFWEISLRQTGSHSLCSNSNDSCCCYSLCFIRNTQQLEGLFMQ